MKEGSMSLLKPAVNHTAYMKVGIMGFAGSGKTYTATEMAIGLASLAKASHIAFFDTEKGSDFVEPKVRAAGIQLLTHRGRAFKDLITVIKEVEQAKVPVLIIDSISHVWRDLCDSYQKKVNRPFLTMQDWGVLKGQWKEFTDAYINSPIHILMLGRAGFTYEQQVNDNGRKEMIQTGTKMKVEGETGFEPDLLMEMDRIETDKGIINRCYVLKDRSDTMNGKTIDRPKFKDFEPFLKYLNIGGIHQGIDTTRNSEDIFDSPDRSYAELQKRTEIALEQVKEALILRELDGTSNEAKKKRTEVLIKIFGTSAWTAISNLKIRELEKGLDQLKIELGLKDPKPAESDDIPFIKKPGAA